MLHSEIFFAFLVTSVALAVVTTTLSRLRIPTIIGFIFTGILIGPSGFNWISSLPAAEAISELGIVLLMFSLGLEISSEYLKKIFYPLLGLGSTQVFLTILVSMSLFVFVFGFDWNKAFIFGSCLALSSTAVVFKLLSERRDTETPYGRIGVIILLFQDIVSVPLMAAVPLLASSKLPSQGGESVGTALFWIVLFLVTCFALGYYVIPKLFNQVTQVQSREVFFFSVISVTFIMAYGAEQVGLSMSLGAFLAGVLISGSPVSKQALAEISPFRDIFLGFFFASVGMKINLDFVVSNFHHLIWILPLILAVKFFILYAVIRNYSRSSNVSFSSALALTQIGEFSLILAALANKNNIISDTEFQYFLALAVFSLLFTPILFYWGLQGKPDKNRDLSVDSVIIPRQAIVIGLGHAGRETLLQLSKNGIPCKGIDLSFEHVKNAKKLGIEAIFGDATSLELLESVGVRNAFLLIITVSGKQVASKILAMIKQLNPTVEVLVRIHYLEEMQELVGITEQQVIVSEIETARAISERVLFHYGRA